MAEQKGWDLQKALLQDLLVKKNFKNEEPAKVMDPANYLSFASQMSDDVVAKAMKLLG